MGKSDLYMGWATHKAVVHACKYWHYSDALPYHPHVKVGAWERGKFIGVVLFARGAGKDLLSPYGLKQNEGCELARVALDEHTVHVTRIVRIAIMFLRKRCPSLQLIVSFADPYQGHCGGIYQGGNWIYTGTGGSDKMYLFKGKRIHSRGVSPSGMVMQQGGMVKAHTPSECKVVSLPPKHRYLFPLTQDMRKKIECLRKDYPKNERVKQAMADYSNLNSGRAALTHTLQSA